MAIIKCPECQNEVSDKASACPKCGCPIREDVSFYQKQYRNEQSIIDGMNYEKGMYKSWRRRQLHLLWLIPLGSIIIVAFAYVLFFI